MRGWGPQQRCGQIPNKDWLTHYKSTWIRLSSTLCRSFAARSAATLGNDLMGVEVQGSDPRSRRQRPGIEEEYKEELIISNPGPEAVP